MKKHHKFATKILAAAVVGALYALIRQFLLPDISETLGNIILFGAIAVMIILDDVLPAYLNRDKPDTIAKKKEQEIQAKDERNIAVNGRACAAAFLATLFALFAAICVLAIAGYFAPMLVVLSVTAVGIATLFIAIWYYNGKM